jgi:hypothetical protein
MPNVFVVEVLWRHEGDEVVYIASSLEGAIAAAESMPECQPSRFKSVAIYEVPLDIPIQAGTVTKHWKKVWGREHET